jgi:large subunit ribosomal protein L21
LPPAEMMYWETLPTRGTPESNLWAMTLSTSRMSGSTMERPVEEAGVETCKALDRFVFPDYREAMALCPCTGRVGFDELRRNVILQGSVKIHLQNFLVEEVNMYAVIKTGGKQYRVAAGEKIKVEQIAADVGQEIVIDQVLAVGNGAELKVGTPLVSGATVTVTVISHGKHDKVRIFKMRRRKHYQKRQGHRQQFTELQIGAIKA